MLHVITGLCIGLLLASISTYFAPFKRPPIRLILFYIISTPLIFTVISFLVETQRLLAYFFLSLLLLAAVVDHYTLEVPNRFVLAVLLLAMIRFFFIRDLSLFDQLIGFIIVSIPLLIISCLTGGSIGGGDIKLVAACGLFLGYKLVFLGCFIGIVLGGLWGALLLLTKAKNKKDALPLVPFLAIGLGISYLYGTPILTWYGRFLMAAH